VKLIGTITGVVTIILAAQLNIRAWPVGIQFFSRKYFLFTIMAVYGLINRISYTKKANWVKDVSR
jgi:nicotinamide riboside transporter PnuC